MKSRIHSKRVDKIAKELGVPREVVNLVIKEYFNSMRRAMKRGYHVYVRGFFRLKNKKKR